MHSDRGASRMRHLNDTVASYLATWNETDPARRRALAAEAVTEDSSYVDPLAAVEGIEGLDAVIAAAQQQFAGLRFELDAGPEAHHDRVRFRWRLVAPAGGEPVA